MSVVVFMCEFMVVFVVAYAGTVCVSGSVYGKLWGSLFLSDSLVFVRASVCACVCDPLRHLAIHYACREQQTPKCHTSWASLKIKTHTLTVLHSQTNNIRTNPNTHTSFAHTFFWQYSEKYTYKDIKKTHRYLHKYELHPTPCKHTLFISGLLYILYKYPLPLLLKNKLWHFL